MKTLKVNKSIKALFPLCLFVLCSHGLNAQDKMTLRNGDEMNVKVTEKTDEQIKYKKESNIEGPTYVVSKANVFSIKYSNGATEVFGATQPYVSTRPRLDYDGRPIPVVTDTNEFLTGVPKKFGGPRVGLTFITNGTTAQQLSDLGKNPLIVQIGWQFEQRIFTIDNGACGLVEFVPLVGGMEQGLFLPSANLLIGLRSGGKRSFEFALGPNVSLTGLGMVFAAGTNFHSGKINFPINIAVVPSVGSKKDVYDNATGLTNTKYFQTGWRISLTVGFNSRKK